MTIIQIAVLVIAAVILLLVLWKIFIFLVTVGLVLTLLYVVSRPKKDKLT